MTTNRLNAVAFKLLFMKLNANIQAQADIQRGSPALLAPDPQPHIPGLFTFTWAGISSAENQSWLCHKFSFHPDLTHHRAAKAVSAGTRGVAEIYSQRQEKGRHTSLGRTTNDHWTVVLLLFVCYPQIKQKPCNIQSLHTPNILNFFFCSVFCLYFFNFATYCDLNITVPEEHVSWSLLHSPAVVHLHGHFWALLGDGNNYPTPWEAEELPAL